MTGSQVCAHIVMYLGTASKNVQKEKGNMRKLKKLKEKGEKMASNDNDENAKKVQKDLENNGFTKVTYKKQDGKRNNQNAMTYTSQGQYNRVQPKQQWAKKKDDMGRKDEADKGKYMKRSSLL
jgi:hypothetical protein